MIARVLMAGLLVTAFAAPAMADSAGRLACETDLKRFSDMYERNSPGLTPAEQQQAKDLIQVGKSRCESDGSNALNTKSPEAMALIEKMERLEQTAEKPKH